MQPQRILLIEDEDYIRDLYKRQLDLAGFLTDGFAMGEEGFKALSQTHYDLILLDIMLPDTNGLEILKKIKQSEQLKNIPVILLTNLGQDAIIKEGFQLGAEGYLVKAAYTPNQIVEEIKNIFAKQQGAPATPTTPPQQPQG